MRNYNGKLLLSLVSLAGGCMLGYFYCLTREVNYEKTLTAADAGQRVYSGINDLIQLFKKSSQK